jgi:hypothetical protein
VRGQSHGERWLGEGLSGREGVGTRTNGRERERGLEERGQGN